jgi:hypothetical protein
MDLKGLKIGKAFSIETSSDSTLILKEKIKEALGFKLNRISFWNLSDLEKFRPKTPVCTWMIDHS